MNKTEFSALPPALQRDVRCAVAIGWPLDRIRKTAYGIEVFEKRVALYPWRRWNPTQSREIWAGLLEAFPIDVLHWPNSMTVMFVDQLSVGHFTSGAHLPTAIVCEVIRRDPLWHLGRSGL